MAAGRPSQGGKWVKIDKAAGGGISQGSPFSGNAVPVNIPQPPLPPPAAPPATAAPPPPAVRAPETSSSVSGGPIDFVFERRAVIQATGDVDELFSVSVRNVGNTPYSFAKSDAWVQFRITDSAAECLHVHDSEGASEWNQAQQGREFVVATLPGGDIAAGGERIFGARLLRRIRVNVNDQQIPFADPLLLEPSKGSFVNKALYRATVIFPERRDGWRIAASGACVSDRTATWEFPADGSLQQYIYASAAAPAANPATLPYDDILAELRVLVWRDLCGVPSDLSTCFAEHS